MIHTLFWALLLVCLLGCGSSGAGSPDGNATDSESDSSPETSTDSEPDAGDSTDDPIESDSFLPNDGPDYDAIFVGDRLTNWELDIDDDQWILLLVDPDIYVEADLTVDGVSYPKVGVRILGKTDRAKVSMRIRFDQVDPKQTFHGVKRVNLHAQAGDTSLVREALALSLMRDAGVLAPRSSFVWMTVNQGSEGVYTLIEQVDKKFLADRFGEDDGNLYKGERGASLLYFGDAPSLYPESIYELKTNEDANDRSDLVHFTRVLNESAPEELDDALPKVLDVDGFLRWLAVNTYIVSMDSYAGSVDNYYFYHGADGRFRFIPWDLNQAFGNYHGASCSGAGALDCDFPMGASQYATLDPEKPYCACSEGMRPLIEKVLARPVFLERYREIFRELLNDVLELDRVKDKMHTLRDLIEESAHLDTQKACYESPCTNDRYDAALEHDDPETDISNRVPGLIPFVELRDQTVRDALDFQMPTPPMDGERGGES